MSKFLKAFVPLDHLMYWFNLIKEQAFAKVALGL